MEQLKTTDIWLPMHENETRFFVDTPFARKIVDGADVPDDEKGALELMGYGSTWVEDRDEEYVAPDAFDHDLEAYLQKNPIMLWQHDLHQPIGQVRQATVDENGLGVSGWQPRPEEREPDWKHLAYHSVKKGIVKTFSIGGYFERDIRKVAGKSRSVINRVRLMELSVVSIPSNPDSIFEAAIKSINGGSRRPELTVRHVQQMTQLLGCREMTDPELLLMNEKQRYERYEELAAYYRKTGRRPPEYEEYHELAKEVLGSQGINVGGPAKRMIAFMQRVNGYVPEEPKPQQEKAGRAISRKNEDKLSTASSLIVEVLESIKKESDDLAEAAEIVAERLSNGS